MKDDQITGYELSRNWFDWCFENTDLISCTHTAMYFFIIEHWNRMGQKEKFGLPMEMTKDALGIKNYRTFSRAFNDLIDWGFIKVHQRSKNQYSANVIALVKNTKATTKALTKATLKQLQKQVRGIVGVDKPNNLVTLEPNNSLSWREDFKIFQNEVNEALEYLSKNKVWIDQQQRFNPNLDIPLTLEKAVVNFWGTVAGWKNKKKTKTEVIDWEATLRNAISQPANKVYKLNSAKPTTQGRIGQILQPDESRTADLLAKFDQKTATA